MSAMPDETNRVMERMLERLFAAMSNSPSLNCRPHRSRQRIDLTQLRHLRDIDGTEALRRLIVGDGEARLVGRVTQPPPRVDFTDAEPTEDERRAEAAWASQKSLLNKLRVVTSEARTYENDTGVGVLNIGFPLLAMPPGVLGGGRVLAPCAFIPVTLTVAAGARLAVEIACREDGIDRVVPNTALLAWLERQTGKTIGDLFEDEEGEQPWREIAEIVRHVAATLEINPPTELVGENWPEGFSLSPAPRADDFDATAAIFPSAVVGLFPMSNQGLLRDSQAMAKGESLVGPVEPFVRHDARLDELPDLDAPDSGSDAPREAEGATFRDERFVTLADPCQSQAARNARTCPVLVIHGPPGTGKSQTITNIIGDHLAQGQRVLFVCDKRTALDVVANRMEHLGLGDLCVTVHDPQRDQRDLYRAVRDRLDELPDRKTRASATGKVDTIDDELTRLHAELTEYHEDLMKTEGGGASFHERIGRWLSIDTPAGVDLPRDAFAGATQADLERHTLPLDDLLRRAASIDYGVNPWRDAAGLTLEDLLARPVDDVRAAVRRCVDAAGESDATTDAAIPPFAAEPALTEQAAARVDLAARLCKAVADVDPDLAKHWAAMDAGEIDRAHARIDGAHESITTLRGDPLDAELLAFTRDDPPKMSELARQTQTIREYLRVKSKWWGFIAFGTKSQAKEVLADWALPADVPAAQRLHDFLVGYKHRMICAGLLDELNGHERDGDPPDDAALDRGLDDHAAVVRLLQHTHETSALRSLATEIHRVLADGSHATLAEGLDKSRPRAAAIDALQTAIADAALFAPAWRASIDERLHAGETLADDFNDLSNRLDTLEDVLRVGESVAGLPGSLATDLPKILDHALNAHDARAVLEKKVLEVEIASAIRSNTRLRSIDAGRIEAMFDRFSQLESDKRDAVRDHVLHTWVQRQRERLLVGTGSRMNSLGADLKRRLLMRGKRAMRLRQVIAMGRDIEGGDPLMDMCPVWMASPETVAQVFPREPVFDLVIFDEASQCRLEEALPVLTRARRVTIAGDPKQLPPTRFFESAVSASDDDGEIETDQDLFEVQQGEVEDLLTASLAMEIEQSYLDVHYRSRNADLIEFSNQQFYGSRLQAIPGHPSRVSAIPPITLERAAGVYNDGLNPTEADHVVATVERLLDSDDPPSIGVASFNVKQRDLISEKLDERAAADEKFARRLAKARERQGEGSFEGLFVKNLENVQGDERDHIVISTTYGPNEEGRFYRRFGPLGRVGGGRRLNVLVTRARKRVHLVTSIPPEAYRALPPAPQGQTPTGGWLLFAYLHFAEELAAEYSGREAESVSAGDSGATFAANSVGQPSEFAEALGRRMSTAGGVASHVHWGNDGFCVDLALADAGRPGVSTIGVMVDGCRFADGYDPVRWDVYRTGILRWQGWELRRVWSPQFFRDPVGTIRALATDVDAAGRNDEAT